MTCEMFRTRLGSELDATALEHLRGCEDCLNAAAAVDPFLMFRSLGGQEMEPDGGTEAFVEEVMQQIHFDARRKRMQPSERRSSWLRWSVAAAVLTGLLTFGVAYRPGAGLPVAQPLEQIAMSTPLSPITRPVVEHYDGANAFIVEVPESSNDMQLVMIFDDSLPADL